ncbi:MAG: hypothetical protein RLZZ539_1169 [Pseudomonadota bacterium]
MPRDVDHYCSMLTKNHTTALQSFSMISNQGIYWLLALVWLWAGALQAQPLMADLKPILDTKTHSIYIYKSSVKNLPPDWKKVWVLTNFYPDPNQPPLTVLSTRRNVLFDCRKNRFSTLALIRYGEPNALGKPLLQTDSGFDLKEREVPEGSAMEIIKGIVCGS